MIAAILLVLVVVLFRVIAGFMVAGGGDPTWLSNFSPLAAVALCGAIYLPKRLAIALPLAALFISDLALNARYGASMLDASMLVRYAALALVAGLGFLLRGRARLGSVALASLGGSTLFYAVTNTASWLVEPLYAKTAAGWLQALTIGLPGFPPSLLFFRNSLLSDLLFTLLFVGCAAWSRAAQPATLPVPERA